MKEIGKREKNAKLRDRNILEAASRLFAKNGFESTKISDVAKLANVSVGTIYLRYPNKSSLLAGVLNNYENRFVEVMKADHIQNLKYPERFTEMFRALIDLAIASPEMKALMQLATYAGSDEWDCGRSIKEAIAQNIKTAQERGTFRKGIEPELAAAIAYGMIDGVIHHMVQNNLKDPDPYVATLTDATSRWLLKTK